MENKPAHKESRSNDIPTQPWQIEDIHRHFPKHTHDEVLEALEDCQRELSAAENRNRILECMQSRLAPQAGDGVD
ncbi:MAG: hypothetical protein H0X66_12215 [Verrucomicrobia bacterium]|nr:hypothetical protein [Verrucomicrobiota bacterium]